MQYNFAIFLPILGHDLEMSFRPHNFKEKIQGKKYGLKIYVKKMCPLDQDL